MPVRACLSLRNLGDCDLTFGLPGRQAAVSAETGFVNFHWLSVLTQSGPLAFHAHPVADAFSRPVPSVPRPRVDRGRRRCCVACFAGDASFSQRVRVVAEKNGETVHAPYLPELRCDYTDWMNGSEGLRVRHASRHVVRLVDRRLFNCDALTFSAPTGGAHPLKLCTLAS